MILFAPCGLRGMEGVRKELNTTRNNMITDKYTEKNFVKNGGKYEWAMTFRAAGLGELPDPNNEYNVPELEEWLSMALVHRGMEKSTALEIVREQGTKFCR